MIGGRTGRSAWGVVAESARSRENHGWRGDTAELGE